MNPSLKLYGGIAVVVLALGGTIIAWHFMHRPNPYPTPGTNPVSTTVNIADFDQFQSALAQRVMTQLGEGAGSSLSVVVATTAYPVGTLLRAAESVPADMEDCVPAKPPQSFAAEHLFPAYSLSTDTALTANLGSNVMQGLDSAGVDLQHTSNVQYTIANAAIQIMDDKTVEEVTGQGGCGKYISAHPGMRLIRGAVMGKMTFTVKVDNPASVKAQFAKVGGFSVNDNPESSTLSISDNEIQPIVILLSEFNTASAAPAAKPAPEVHADSAKPPMEKPVPVQMAASAPLKLAPLGSAGPAATAQAPQNKIFIQQDANDKAGAGAKMAKLIRAAWPQANVVPKIEIIPSKKMPIRPQVRFFNASDAALADKLLAILKQTYSDAHKVRIGMPSPQGQIEIWLPRAGS